MRMGILTKERGAAFALWLLLMSGGFAVALAQDAGSAKPAQASPAPQSSYQLTFTLTELEAGRKVDSRQYELHLGAGLGRTSMGRLQIGTRIPAGFKTDGTAQSLEVGTVLTANVNQYDGGISLDTTCDITSIVPDEGKVDGRPILHTFTITNSMPLVENKTMLVGTADDPSSKREFQLEVTAAPAK